MLGACFRNRTETPFGAILVVLFLTLTRLRGRLSLWLEPRLPREARGQAHGEGSPALPSALSEAAAPSCQCSRSWRWRPTHPVLSLGPLGPCGPPGWSRVGRTPCRPHQRKGASGRVSGKAPPTGPQGSGPGGRCLLQRLCLCIAPTAPPAAAPTPGPLTVTQRGLHGHLLLVSYFLENSYFSTTWSPRRW